VVEQPPCKRQVGGSNPFSGSLVAASVLLKSRARLLPYPSASEEVSAGVRGGVPEWPKGAGCKPAGLAYGGSNPPAPMEHMLL
jgi:hypothetical protein